MEEGSGVLENSRSTKKLVGSSPEGSNKEFEDNNINSSLRVVETFLRLLPIALCVTSLVLLLKNSQENEYGSVNYTDFSALRYLVHANGICAGYSLFSAIVVAWPRLSAMSRDWTVFLLDQLLTYIILAAGAASIELLYLAEKGNTSTTWSKGCGYFGPFCDKVIASTAITFVAVVCYVLLSLISSYKLFTKYDAPTVTNPTVPLHTATFHA